MFDTKVYWTDKFKRTAAAVKHTKQMAQNYKDAIESSYNNRKEYSKLINTNINHNKNTKFVLTDEDSVSAIISCSKDNAGKKIAVLNFASYKNPGGMFPDRMFIKGSKAQEECLCMESNLYNILVKCESFYEWNNSHLNNGLYLNRAIYAPDVIFTRDANICKCDVITCACPNFSVMKRGKITKEDNSSVLKDRIDFVLSAAANNNVDVLILGAYGCGGAMCC